MKKEELKKVWEEAPPSSEELDSWGKEIVKKGEILYTIFTLFEFLAAIVGAAVHLIPTPSNKKSIKEGGYE